MDSPVVREAYDLNIPMQTVPGNCASFSAFQVDAANVFIDTVKPAEDGSGDLILRLYEAKRADTACRLTLGIPAESACLCDLLENPGESLDPRRMELRFHPFEIKTVRIRPVRTAG